MHCATTKIVRYKCRFVKFENGRTDFGFSPILFGVAGREMAVDSLRGGNAKSMWVINLQH